MLERHCDVLVIGGSLGGVAGAIRAAAMGTEVILIEESDWIGGQLTSQGVCTPDENRWIEHGGGTASYRDLRRRIREHYRQHHILSAKGAAQPFLNPGSCWVSRISVEPKIGRQILMDMLGEYETITLMLETTVTGIRQESNRIVSVDAEMAGVASRIVPKFVLEATETGSFLAAAGIEHVLGAESRDETGESDAAESARPEWIQPFTVPFALELRPRGENHTIPGPDRFEELKQLQNYHVLDGAMKGMFGDLGWWTYRRVIAAENFSGSDFPCDVAMINTGSNDFKGGVIPTHSEGADSETIQTARLASLGYVYWLQTECPRVDEPGAFGYPEFKLRGDWFDTADGVAPSPYIRESRRIQSMRTVLQQEIVSSQQPGLRAASFPDSCGIGHYWLDIHDGGTDEPNRFMETRPFQIPLGALIPIRSRNLLAACKNLGVTHLTNGAYRLHPIEWNIGESAGALAAYCALDESEPARIWGIPSALQRFQKLLLENGIPLYWWGDLASEHPAFKAAQWLAMRGIWPESSKIEFEPESVLDEKTRTELNARSDSPPLPEEPLTRGEAAIILYKYFA